MELNGLFHYNALPVAASPTLIGKHVVIQDNQGGPGPEPAPFKQVRRNQIATVLIAGGRSWTGSHRISPPLLADGNRLYIRGERYLYCIGEP